MKKRFNTLLFLFIVPLGILSQVGCDKDDDHTTNPVDLLPPATQTGENTVGALVNGEAFLPKGGGLAPNKNCYYQFVEGEYYFVLWFSEIIGGENRTIGISANKSTIAEGENYSLNSNTFFGNNDISSKGAAYSEYSSEPFLEKHFVTTSEFVGELIVTKLDFENHIVSGTFWFNAVNEEGEMVEVREGRFDMQFTQ